MIDIIFCIDPGSKNSGFVLVKNGQLSEGGNADNENIFLMIDNFTMFPDQYRLTVVYEDIRPYTSRFNMDTINTCKMIGRLEYVLQSQLVPFKAITRNEVKSYYFDKFREVTEPYATAKIEKKGRLRKDGTPVKPSFLYMDDRIITKCVRLDFGIPAGKKNTFGLKTHAWQALAVYGKYRSGI